jgi:hypothetical protein
MTVDMHSVDVFLYKNGNNSDSTFYVGHKPNVLHIGPMTFFFEDDGNLLEEFAEFVARASRDTYQKRTELFGFKEENKGNEPEVNI